MTVDELTRLAFIYGEQDRATLLDAYANCTSEADEALKKELRDLIKRMHDYRVNRWGRARLEEMVDKSHPVSIAGIK